MLGKSFHSCPYYGSRTSLPSAELVVLPYQMLLHKPTRESLGIDIKGSSATHLSNLIRAGNIVVIDEAHNLIDSINQMYSVELTAKTLAQVRRHVYTALTWRQTHAQLEQYHTKYEARLHPSNKRYIKIILFITRQLINFLHTKQLDGIVLYPSAIDFFRARRRNYNGLEQFPVRYQMR